MLRGEKVILRAIEREDLPNYVQWLNDPVVLEYFVPYRPLTLTQEEKWYEEMLQDESVCNFAIEFEGRHIGGTGLNRINYRHANAEVGIFIGVPELWDRGLGRDALRTVVNYGFTQLNLHRIYLRVFAENKRAIRAYEKVGFQHEGRMREIEFRHGRYHDLLWMSILRREWEGWAIV